MKLISLLDHLAATPPAGGAAPRRALLQQLGRAAVAALPLGLGAALPAAAETKDTSLDAVSQLLLLERLVSAFYTRALAVNGLIPAAQAPDFQRILRHQNQHVALLTQALQDGGAILPPMPAFDFSGQRNVAANPVLFPNVLSVYDDFLALAQQLEDLSVRLYKGQVFNIAYDAKLYKAALRIHAVEAEHSAHVRGLRRSRGATVKNWPSSTDAAIARPAGAQALATAATGGEENLLHERLAGATVPFPTILNVFRLTFVSDESIAEAFDEPISSAAAQAALSLFF
ncbi:ferritin-like domain-containing protein [Hymenobacter ruricola]|uniref:Ferritin-like domain-containing protein n=1 Tax=Hymenobacter ruricola TaxID=2791023 RepID=A0ABS0IAG7_9BACT|nr:ferritin-like domain-containing protein [Hymenobacter ruricola]MBF9223958.1 ferritin-like domain-containing protein [Hymenobacter ruricola]